MILWTIQTQIAHDGLRSKGVLRTSKDWVIAREPFYESAYDWLVERMIERIGPPPAMNLYPLWAWFQIEGKQKAPDLRQSAWGSFGKRYVRLKIDVPDQRVLLSDFMLWHHPLNYFYLPANQNADLEFERKLAKRGLCQHKTKPLPDPNSHRAMVKSWDRIFDLTWEDEYISSPYSEKSIQGTFWELTIDQVLEARPFVAR